MAAPSATSDNVRAVCALCCGGDQDKKTMKYINRYSYPTIVVTREGSIHVAYTYRRVGIKYIGPLTEEWVKQGGTVGKYQPPKVESR